MKVKHKNLNDGECYPCRIQDVKDAFSQTDDIFVGFGFFGREYCFDTKFLKRPKISGTVVAAFQINKRLEVDEMSPVLSFYVIRDRRYTDEKRTLFVETVLPQMSKWYRETITVQKLIPGVEVFLAEWTGEDFKLHITRYK